jgi:hypothetical protein
MTPPVVFAFADPARRTWLALNHEGTAYHWVHPIDAGDMRVRDELRRVGELTCECAGGRFRGTCYVVKAAEACLLLMTLQASIEDWKSWFDGPPGEIAEAWGK